MPARRTRSTLTSSTPSRARSTSRGAHRGKSVPNVAHYEAEEDIEEYDDEVEVEANNDEEEDNIHHHKTPSSSSSVRRRVASASSSSSSKKKASTRSRSTSRRRELNPDDALLSHQRAHQPKSDQENQRDIAYEPSGDPVTTRTVGRFLLFSFAISFSSFGFSTMNSYLFLVVLTALLTASNAVSKVFGCPFTPRRIGEWARHDSKSALLSAISSILGLAPVIDLLRVSVFNVYEKQVVDSALNYVAGGDAVAVVRALELVWIVVVALATRSFLRFEIDFEIDLADEWRLPSAPKSSSRSSSRSSKAKSSEIEIDGESEGQHWIPYTAWDILYADAYEWAGRIAFVWYLFVLGSAQMYALDLSEIWVPISMAISAVVVHYVKALGEPKDLGKWIFEQPRYAAAVFAVSIFLTLTCWSKSGILPVRLQTITQSWETLSVPGTGGLISLSNVSFLLGLFIAVRFVKNVIAGSGLPLKDKLLLAIPIIVLWIAAEYKGSQECGLVLGKSYGEDASNAKPLLDLIEAEVWKRAGDGSTSAHRVLHAKAHACAKAKFVVREELQPDHRVGIFSNPGSVFESYLRFSNGAGVFQPDSVADVRGMAIKVVDVPSSVGGKRLIPEDTLERKTQDFVLLSTPQFFTGGVQDYAELLGATLSTPGLLRYIFNSWNPLDWTITPLLNAARMARQSAGMTNPLSWTYHSTTPYRFGPTKTVIKSDGDDDNNNNLRGGISHTAVKYRARPCRTNTAAYKKRAQIDYARRNSGKDDNFLRTAMRQQLLEEGACFEIQMLRQSDACAQPIDDPTVVWDGQWDTVADLIVEKQEPLKTDFQGFCENLSFTPWHGFDAHRPIGAVNRARLAAYKHGAMARRRINNATEGTPMFPAEPTGKEIFDGEAPLDRSEGAGNTDAWNYASYPVPVQSLPKLLELFPAQGVIANIKALIFGLPEDEPQQFDVPKATRIALFALEETLTKLKFESGSGKPYDKWTTPQDYDQFFDPNANPDAAIGTLPIPEISKNGEWATDEGFSWQFIRGLNPMKLTNVSAIGFPDGLDMSPERVKAINDSPGMKRDKVTVDSLLRDHALFAVDYPELVGLPTEPGRVVYAPSALFRRSGKNLLPVTIQLTRGKGKSHRQFYPSDEKSWLLAKMILANSDSIQHEMSSHLMATHLAMEPIVIGFYRQFTLSHPIMKLMKQHFRQTIAINNLGRETLLSPTDSIIGKVVGAGITGGLVLMAKDYAQWDFTEKSFENELKSRGFETENYVPETESDKLPGFFYRDDGLKVFRAMRDYVSDALKEVGYDKPNAVADDLELQALIRELKDPLGGKIKGLPAMKSFDDLVFFLTSIMYLGTAQHSSVNFGQYEFLAFAPNRPLILTRGMPIDPSTVDDAYIMSALPDFEKLCATVQIIRVISLPPKYTLGVDMISGPSLKDGENVYFPKAFKKFQKRLEEIDALIDGRNERWKVDYSYLKPSHIAGSIAI